jgi:predicted nuclease of predicted toxin-antitoxin system
MMIWVDAQMSPSIATWISSTFGVTAVAVREVGLRDAKDQEELITDNIKRRRLM